MGLQKQEHIHRLWDALADFDASQWGQASTYLMQSLCDLSRSWNATWAGAIRVDSAAGDPLQGWRMATVHPLHPIATRQDERLAPEPAPVRERAHIDPSALLPFKGMGAFRARSLRRELPNTWFGTPFFDHHYGAHGIQDAVFVAFPLNSGCESHFVFYSKRTFTDEEIAHLAGALRGIKWFHRHLMLGHGLLVASAPLTPTERRVLQLLLTKDSEKDISRKMETAVSTTHQHVTRIFRKFGVRSRAELMSLWLTRAG